MSRPGRILVVDDEELARRRVVRFVRAARPDSLVEEADSGIAAVEAITRFRPDVVFLDVEMPGMSGFELLRQFDERRFEVIFETAHDEFAVRAFEEEACDYLLKPFTSARLAAALERALGRGESDSRLRRLEARLADREGYLRRLAVRQGARLRVAADTELDCFVSRDHVTCAYFADGREGIVDLSLARLEERLDPDAFSRVHRNAIVRLGAVSCFRSDADTAGRLELANGMRIAVSRRFRSEVKSRIGRL